jgi:hypothetical protein
MKKINDETFFFFLSTLNKLILISKKMLKILPLIVLTGHYSCLAKRILSNLILFNQIKIIPNHHSINGLNSFHLN